MIKFKLILSLIIFIILNGCAKQSAPMGGPIDEKKPEILSITPVENSLNIKPKEVVLLFDEYIKLDNPTKNIIITPRIKTDEIEISAIKNSVKIILNQDLEENTTYVFNFQNAIIDLSEGNTTDNLRLVFSTGNQIDSLRVIGKVNYYFPKEKEDFQKVIVGLYMQNDSTTGFKNAPYYLSQIDSVGNFQINNIKPGKYTSFAWEDDNSNLKIDFKSERFDFFLDTLDIKESIDNLYFNLSLSDQTPIKILRSTPTGKQYEIVLNKNASDISFSHEKLGKSIFYSTHIEKRIKLYSMTPLSDSISINLMLKDSALNSIDTTIYAKFVESDRKPEKLIISGNTGKSFFDEIPIEIKFNKPIKSILYDSLYISYDTAQIIKILPSMISFTDSLMRTNLHIKVPIDPELPFDLFTIHASDSTFQDIDDIYNEKPFIGNYRKLKRESLSDAITGTIINGNNPFIIQLINSKSEILHEQILIDSNQYTFTMIEPGTYKIRVIEDLNQNYRWDPSNFKLNQYAERVTYFENSKTNSREITIRAGWTLENQDIIFKPKTGYK